VVVIYVDLPGHENGASDLTIQFPTIQQIGEDLVTVLDQLRVKYVIGIGDGAGANIMARFGMMHKTRYARGVAYKNTILQISLAQRTYIILEARFRGRVKVPPARI
jgi:pimeloyl-ACP methyl ester carboxylesterase